LLLHRVLKGEVALFLVVGGRPAPGGEEPIARGLLVNDAMRWRIVKTLFLCRYNSTQLIVVQGMMVRCDACSVPARGMREC
jgi:hypothetical protein